MLPEAASRVGRMTRVALVTGGSRGIGRATALELAAAGLDVALTYKRSRVDAEQVVATIEKTGRKALAIQMDLELPEEIERGMAEVGERFGHLDVLVANAAATAFKPLLEVGRHNLERTFAISVHGFLRLVQLSVPLMSGRLANIVAVSGWDGYRALTRHGVLGAAKAAMEALVRSLAVELADRDICVNAVCPGPLDTDSARTYAGEGWDEMVENWVARTPARRLGTAEDIARIVRFLASNDCRWLRGQVLYADGGQSLVTEPVAWFGGRGRTG